MRFTIETLGYIKFFENVTKSNVKDCFIDKNNNLVFVVKPGQASKAIGKKGDNIKKLSSKFNKRIKIIEYSEDPIQFVKNAVYPLRLTEVRQEENIIIVKADSTQQKALLLGRDKQNLKALQALVDKFFKIEVKVE